MTHGAKIVHASEVFDGPSVLEAISTERCTAVHVVPAMFDTLFSLPRPADFGRAELPDGTVLVGLANDCADAPADDDLDLTQSSSKLEALVRILEATKGDGNKTVIFSQWTRFLDIVQSRLDTKGYKYCRLDGTMSASKRDEALQASAQDQSTTVMLVSLRVCAVGLHLTAVNNVVLSDIW